jgi:hypothetical protein
MLIYVAAQAKMLNDFQALILLLTNRFLAILIIAQQSLFPSPRELTNKTLCLSLSACGAELYP